MKKLFLLILAFVSVVVTAGCNFEIPGVELPEIELPSWVPELPWLPGGEDEGEDEVELSKELKDGVSFLKQLYEKAAVETGADFVRVGKAAKCTVTWTVTVTSGNAEDVKIVANEDGSYTIDVNEKAESDVEYTLTATVTYGEESTTLSFNHKLPKFRELTYAEYAAKEIGDAVVVKGIVVGILSKDLGDTVDALYLHTPEGGFYIYGVKNADVTPMTSYQLGMEVRASGTFDNYNGTLEVKDATCEILNSTPVDVTPVDLTEAYKAAANLQDASILGKQSMLVTLKGVTIGAAGDNGYYYFTLGEKQTYMRISSSTCPLNAADSKKFAEEWTSHVGWTADITGVVSIYSGNFYLQPCTLEAAAVYKSLPELDDAGAVAFEKGNLTVSEKDFKDGAEVTLPTTGSGYTDVTISWESNSENVVIENGVAKVTLGNENVNLVLTATISRGNATDTKEFSFTILAVPVTVTQLANAAVGDMVLVKGVVTEIAKVEYGNIYISDGVTNFYVYGVYNADGAKHGDWAEEDQLAVGDVVTLLGLRDAYKDSPQLGGKAVLIERTKGLTVEEVLATENGTQVAVTGTITEIAKVEYGNLYIKDAAGNTIYIYGIYDFAGAKHGDWAEELQLAVGDVITVVGERSEYKGTHQVKNTTLISAAAGSDEPTPDPDPTPNPTPVVDYVTAPAVDTEYYLSMVTTAKGQVYFTGAMSGYYGASSEDATAAVKVVLVAVDGGYNVKFTVDGATKYINAEVSGTHLNFVFGDSANTVWTWNTEINALTTVLSDGDVFIGTYGTYFTFGISKMEKVETSFVARLYEVKTSEPTPDPDPTPEPSVVTTIPAALESADGTAVELTGTVVKIGIPYDSGYNNISVYIADENGVELYVFRLTGDVTVGKIIKVSGTMGSYNGTKQIAQGATFEEVGTHTCSTYTAATCQKPASCVVCKTAKDDVLAEHNYVDGVCSVCGGTVGVEVATESKAIAASTGTLASDGSTITWTADNFTLVSAKNNTNAIRTQDTDHFRAYAGGSTTVSGSKITKVVITCTSATYAEVCAGSIKTEGVTASVSGSVVTFTVDEGTLDSIVIGATAQWRLNSIEVTYQK